MASQFRGNGGLMAIRSRVLFLTGAAYGFLGVMLGAFGAHALRPHLSERYYAAWQTGVEYLGLHGVVLLFVSLLTLSRWSRAAGGLLALGAGLFGGSLFLMAGLNIPGLGILTPVGGMLMLAGWASLFMHGLRG
jgi:uncharacterized membrane protein YgdD (TMEM256/DUF423 family)